MAPPPDDDDHDCGWKQYARQQDAKLAELTDKLAALERRVLAKKSEKRKSSKLPPPLPPETKPEAAAQKRADNALLRAAKLDTETTQLVVPPEQRSCRSCGATELSKVGKGKSSTIYEYVQPYFRKRIFERETLSCRCGHIVTAPAPPRMGEKTRYAPSFVAHLVVNKCGDSNPQYRLEKAYRNLGIPMSRSTMCNLVHRAAAELKPIYDAALKMVPQTADVHADETSMRQQDLARRSFVWSFVTPELIIYRYATTRSGSVPSEVLGDSQGRLVVDQYTGYNAVTKPGRRERAGCLAHARRKLYEQREHSEVEVALELIADIYRVEREAKAAGISGSDEHLALRKQKSRPLFARLLCWARSHRDRYAPKSGMAKALRYLLKNFREHGRFLRYASIPPDNNIAEASLRRIALGRGNYLFFGHEEAGANFAVLYTLVASCEKHGINAIDYVADVLTRVHSHPKARIDELLPHRWKPPDPPARS